MNELMAGYPESETSKYLTTLKEGGDSVTAQLERQKQRLESNLKNVNAALDALKANPEVEKCLNLVSIATRQ